MNSTVKSLLAGIGGISLLISSTAYAATSSQGDWYAGISGDLTWMRQSDTGVGGNIDLGYQFQPSTSGDFRVEGEVGYQGAGGENGYSSTHIILAIWAMCIMTSLRYFLQPVQGGMSYLTSVADWAMPMFTMEMAALPRRLITIAMNLPTRGWRG